LSGPLTIPSPSLSASLIISEISASDSFSPKLAVGGQRMLSMKMISELTTLREPIYDSLMTCFSSAAEMCPSLFLSNT
jgi:hypothetical protein